MLNFESNTMRLPLSVASSSDYIHRHQESKQPLSPISPNQLYLRQPHTLQVIQLVECSPPPRRIGGSAIESSSASSSSSCDYSSEYSESAPSEEEEEVCTSYCSSDEEEESQDVCRPESSADTYNVRMKRIMAWRENFSAHLGTTLSEPILPSSLKRKMSSEDDDNLSHSSKRSRSQSSLGDVSMFSLGEHSCPACDKSFDSRQTLLQHGKEAGANEACCVAVEYAFE